jgi:hypothetical protein
LTDPGRKIAELSQAVTVSRGPCPYIALSATLELISLSRESGQNEAATMQAKAALNDYRDLSTWTNYSELLKEAGESRKPDR